MPGFASTPTGFKELPKQIGNNSINAVTDYLGYKPEQTYFHLGDLDKEFDVQLVILEVFTKNIIVVQTKDGVDRVDLSKVNYYLRALTDDDVFNSYTVNDTLSSGVKNQSLSASFLGRILNIENIEENGVFYAPKLDKYLYFTNGLLADFQSSDGLNQAAKRLRQINPSIIAAYETEAKRYWGNSDKNVINEVNAQAEAWASTPSSVGNEYVPLHRDATGLVNFQMLLVCHYDEPMTLVEFLTLNHGRYDKLSGSTYRLGKFTYNFDDEGEISDIEMS